ncbi:hypothetical protein CO033_02200 [Candidatus Nomurabacteria bacterium CG_4_9_14_0_2_um_filter_32_10]|uniref:Aminotransferase class V domain-containing protein n=3 Tax=Candidatus Nomuraibacteriota TaxID=1752729 RepID=A0A2H0CGS5_9BACT|nr:MAG: hypothetical protein COW91_00995 [Candidatus Nomurabacteria bacterium CG22_combo_CG10-13_8_21_14_all_32_8]PIZ85821.1 MAG: hypothetical protein COX94_01995 [Candidatus Nomurabacteria bacterium CG_4_10_14_0_2_um_filter_33_9]PJC49319.1 MAG: hypothetical protein CO033_02200 [Candidatus Nomurabacteria bacterium CG_4_9_14_0_2_um_filter_32_10]
MAKSNKKIYLDYAAGVKANPSSIHVLGLKAKKELENARRDVANILSARPDEIIFTSGGTESNNLAIQGIINTVKAGPSPKAQGPALARIPHIITTNIEHPSVLETCRMLKRRGLVELSIVSVESNGIVDPKKIKKELKKNTVLVSVMYANNEIGTVQPIREIAKEIRHYKKFNLSKKVWPSHGESQAFSTFPLFHTDAVQAVNYLDLNVEKLGVDLLSLSGSKIEEAGRVGVLYKRKSVSLVPILGGGDQEMGLRPGTENLTEIFKFSQALKLVGKEKVKEIKRLKNLQDYFLKKLKIFNFDFLVNGDLKERLPNNINVTFSKIPSDLLVLELSAKGIMASSKSACKSSKKEGSYVIEAIRKAESRGFPSGNFPEGNPRDDENGGLRFSLGNKTTKADIDYTIKTLSKILQKLKKWYN